MFAETPIMARSSPEEESKMEVKHHSKGEVSRDLSWHPRPRGRFLFVAERRFHADNCAPTVLQHISVIDAEGDRVNSFISRSREDRGRLASRFHLR